MKCGYVLFVALCYSSTGCRCHDSHVVTLVWGDMSQRQLEREANSTWFHCCCLHPSALNSCLEASCHTWRLQTLWDDLYLPLNVEACTDIDALELVQCCHRVLFLFMMYLCVCLANFYPGVLWHIQHFCCEVKAAGKVNHFENTSLNASRKLLFF